MIVEVIFSLSIVIFLTLFLWYRKLPRYRIGNFPSPPSVFLIGHVPYFNTSKKLLPYFHKTLLENNGIVKLLVGPKALLIVSNPEFIQWITSSTKLIVKSREYQHLETWLGQGLLLGTGSHWKALRKILTPAFSYQMIENYTHVVENIGNTLIKKLERCVGENSVDIYPIISSFTFDVVCENSMATSVNALENENSDYLQAVREMCRILIDRAFDPMKMFDFLFRFHPDYKVFKDSVETVHNFDNYVIKERSQMLKEKSINKEPDKVYEKVTKTSLLDTLLTARYENGDTLTDHDIRVEVDTFIFAGYETTASALSFVLYNIANHPTVQEKLFEEQKRIFVESVNRTVTYSDINNMKYLEMVIKETLRLHPPVPLIGRQIHEDTYYNGQLMPEGLTVMLNLYSLHRNPELFPDPEKFDPMRFDDDTKLPMYSYLPFSAGPRNCIGRKFAMIQIKQIVSKIVRFFELLPSSPPHTLEIVGETTIKSKNGICIRLKKRELH